MIQREHLTITEEAHITGDMFAGSTWSGGAHVQEEHMVRRSTCSGGAHGPEEHMTWRSTWSRGAHVPEEHMVRRNTWSGKSYGTMGVRIPERRVAACLPSYQSYTVVNPT